MTASRLPWYGGAVLFVLLAGYALSVAGLHLCSPEPLAGDEAWVWKTRFVEALWVAFGAETQCFLDTRSGKLSLGLGLLTLNALLVAAFACAAWEIVGHPLRRARRRRRGGHAILFGDPGEIEPLAQSLGSTPAAFIARSRASALTIGRRHPFADVSVLDDRRRAEHLLERQGALRAKLVAATTANDLANGELAEAALRRGGEGDVLVRIENGSVRALKGDALRRAAEASQRRLAVVSLHQIRARLALGLALPGRYINDAADRVHIAVCGAGPMMQELAFLIARQGYGWENAQPLLSVMRTGRDDFAAGGLERLVAAEAIEVQSVVVDGEDAAGVDRAFANIALGKSPLVAVHCCEDHEGAAAALALRVERVFVDLGLTVPPIVVHGAGNDGAGDTGMVRIGHVPTLGEALERDMLLDERARAFHSAYIEGQKVERGSAYGDLPAEREWRSLPESFRDDNRASADHLDYKLALANCVAVRRPASGILSPTDLEGLAAAEHARWMARRSITGWRFGRKRDNDALLHPDMRPYSALDEEAQRKDRDQVATIPDQLHCADEWLARLKPVALLSSNSVDRVVDMLALRDRANPSERVLVSVALDALPGIEIAETALKADLLVEAYVASAPERALDDHRLAVRAAAILRRAWHIRAVPGRSAKEALSAAHPVLVDAEGVVHEDVLA